MTSRSARLPLVIVAGPRALPTAAVASRYYAESGIAATVVRPRGSATCDEQFATGTCFIDDEALPGVEAVAAFLRTQIDTLNEFQRSPGWFLQQFIKLAAVSALNKQYIFIADGDTIFSRNLLDTILYDPVVLATGEKFENYDRLLLAMGMIPPSLSCVANGNVFSQAPVLQKLADPVGFQAMLQKHVLATKGALDFSEYQITGSLLEPVLGSRRIRMFRRFDLLIDRIDRIPAARVARALHRYDAVAIEANHHRSIPKRFAARLLYGIGRSW